MSAGDLYRALAMNQNLQPTANNINQFFLDKQKQEGIKNLINLATQYREKIAGANRPMVMGNQTPNVNDLISSTLSGTPALSGLNVQKQFDPNQAQGMVSDLMLNQLQAQPESNYPMLDKIVGMLQGDIERRTPKMKYGSFNAGDQPYRIDERTGRIEMLPQISLAKKPKQYKGHFINKANNHTIVIYDDGTQKDINEGEGILKEPMSPSDAVAWARLGLEGQKFGFEQKKYNEAETEQKKKEQGIYEGIKNSPFVDANTLLARGLIQPERAKAMGNGGAYVVYNPISKTTKLITGKTSEEADKNLENFANTIAPNTPNKFRKNRQKNNYVEGQIYEDANGNKAKYVNGKFQEIK